eukprot:SAG22_NODE_859_length_6830_cov_2.134601_3_plen_129_part_00
MPWLACHCQLVRPYGRGESMVFSMGPPGVQKRGFRRHGWTRQNNCYQQATDEALSMGGGSGYALWLSADLRTGTSAPCETYGNKRALNSSSMPVDAASAEVTFEVAQVELYGLSFDAAAVLERNLATF